MDDFRLKVFVSAAKNLNFSKCAQQMHISQPAVSKHISEIEGRFGVSLFSRSNGGVSLTKAGRVLLGHAEHLLASYKDMEYEMGLLANATRGNMRIGASTTVAQYVLPPVLARFIERFDGVEVSMRAGNSEAVEQWLLGGDIDLGFVENTSRRPGLHYEHLMDDELVLVSATGGRFRDTDSVSVSELGHIPLVLREDGSGTREIIASRLAQAGLRLQDMNIVIELSSTEAIKSFVRSSDSAAIVSVVAVRDELAEGSLKVIDMEGVDMRREFASVARQGEFTQLKERFHRFAERMV